MKTPKRKEKLIIDEVEYDSDGIPTGDIISDFSVYHAAHARGKRKNKIAQLKRTIERLSVENFELKMELGVPTHISFEEYNSRYVDFITPDLISDH